MNCLRCGDEIILHTAGRGMDACVHVVAMRQEIEGKDDYDYLIPQYSTRLNDLMKALRVVEDHAGGGWVWITGSPSPEGLYQVMLEEQSYSKDPLAELGRNSAVWGEAYQLELAACMALLEWGIEIRYREERGRELSEMR